MTQDCINYILVNMSINHFLTGENFAVVRPHNYFDDVDWLMVGIFFNTNDINFYTQPNKVVIECK